MLGQSCACLHAASRQVATKTQSQCLHQHEERLDTCHSSSCTITRHDLRSYRKISGQNASRNESFRSVTSTWQLPHAVLSLNLLAMSLTSGCRCWLPELHPDQHLRPFTNTCPVALIDSLSCLSLIMANFRVSACALKSTLGVLPRVCFRHHHLILCNWLCLGDHCQSYEGSLLARLFNHQQFQA